MSCVLKPSLYTSKVILFLSVKTRSSSRYSLLAMPSTWFIIDCDMGSGVNCFLEILRPVIRLMKLQVPWKFVVGPRYMASFNFSEMVLVGAASSYFSGYVPNYTLQFLD